MIAYTILEEEGILIVEPSGPIEQEDLEALTRDVDSHIRRRGMIRGMIIQMREFPRWRDFAAFLKDMKFVLDHQSSIQRVAVLSDSTLFIALHRMARHVLSPEIRYFPYEAREAALGWIREQH